MDKQETYGFLHCHSDHSLKDSPLKITDLCSHAVKMGAKAISLTDHGTCTGIIEFLKTCKSLGINGIPGVEAYVETTYAERAHLVLLAKNYRGYQELSGAVTDSNKNLKNVGGIMMPIMTKEILKQYFGNGNVIALSGCINGVLSSVLLFNTENERQISKLEEKIAGVGNPANETYQNNKKLVKDKDEEIANLAAEKDRLEHLAQKAYKKRTNGLAVLKETDPVVYQKAKGQLTMEMEESKQAAILLEEIKAKLKNARSLRTNINSRVREAEKDHDKFRVLDEKISELKAKLLKPEELMEKADEELLWFYRLFQDDFYVELQFHGMEAEAIIMPQLALLAKGHDIPVVATNDVHIRDKEQAGARQFMKALRFDKWEDITGPDKELYMKSDRELYDVICQIVNVPIAKEAILNIRKICNACQVEIPEESHYPKYRDENGEEVKDAPALLRQKAEAGILKRYPSGFSKIHQERMDYELDVIISLGYADYLLIVADFIAYARNLSRENNDMKVGYGVGIGRGSGAGSLVNYLLGITGLDPITYGLLFERFLNKDRVTMPDIDTDFSEEVREATISYVKQKYGEESVACIRTTTTQGVKGSIKNSARIRGYQLFPGKKTDPAVRKKRLPLQYLGDAIADEILDVPGIKFADCKTELGRFSSNDEAQVIIKRAKEVEGTITANSIHAAGIIIGDGKPLKTNVPLHYNTKKMQWAVQCDMVESEEIGLFKMDFLGLNTLDIISDCQRKIKASFGITVDLDHLPFEQEVFNEIFCKGKTNCVFQVESGGMKQMLREFRPQKFEDIILLVAAYRPGPMEFIPDIIAVKRGEKHPHYLVPELKDILEPTYGQPIYQEQLMDIFHQCAGFTLGEADIIRRYMSKKKADKFLAYKPKFVNGMVASGASKEEAEELWESLIGFAKYAFNKSHAAAYAMITYITGWLKYHYPREYMCSIMNHAKAKKIPFLLYECKEMKIKVLPPDINKSYLNFTTDGEGAIIYGLNAIKGVDKYAQSIIEERKKNGVYESFMDYMLRAHKNKGVTEKLIKAGVFDSFDKFGRLQLQSVLGEYVSAISAVRKKTAIVKKLSAELQDCKRKDEAKQIEKSMSNATEAAERAKIKLCEIVPRSSIVEDKLEILREEYEILGAYISDHPLNSYLPLFQSEKITLIHDFQDGKYLTYAGMVSNIRFTQRKSDGAKMAFFFLEDITGILEVNCFTDAFRTYENLISEGNVVMISGRGSLEDAFHEGDDPVQKLTVKTIKRCYPQKEPLFISVRSMEAYETQIKKKIAFFQDENGYPVYLHDSVTGDVISLPYRISSDILETNMEGVFIKKLHETKPEGIPDDVPETA